MTAWNRFGLFAGALVSSAGCHLPNGAPPTGDAIQCTLPSPPDGGIDPGTPTVDPARPPARPTVASTEAPKVDRWLAVRTIGLGLTQRDGTPDNSAWKTYGFDLDDRNTLGGDSKRDSNTACRRVPCSGSTGLTDGTHGIDNNFGADVMPVIRSLNVDAEDEVNWSISDGTATLLLHLEGVGPQNDPHVAGALYNAHALGTSSHPSDLWPVESSSLTDGVTSRTATSRTVCG